MWGGGGGTIGTQITCAYILLNGCVCVWGGVVLYYYDIAADSTYVVTDVTQSLIYWAVLITGQM